jgi:Class II flagellar assembly regulator
MQMNGISTINARQMLSVLDRAMPLALMESALLKESGAAKLPVATPAPVEVPVQQQLPATPQTLGSVQVLVTVSTLNPAEERRRVIVAQAKKGLDALDRLHREMLSGKASKASLSALQQWVADMPESDDPKMVSFFKDIELRVRVELAKFDLEA